MSLPVGYSSPVIFHKCFSKSPGVTVFVSRIKGSEIKSCYGVFFHQVIRVFSF